MEDEVVGRPVEARGEPCRGPGGAPRRWPRCRGRRRAPKSASWRRGTIQISNDEREAYGAKATLVVRPPRRAGRAGATSSRTSRQNGHSPSRMTNRAAPPSSSAMRCGIWGRSYRSRHRWFVRAPAWAPQFWTTWRYVGLAGRPGRRPARRGRPSSSCSIRSLPTACSGRCSSGGATTVRQLPVARAWARATWRRGRGRARGPPRRCRRRGTRSP